MTDHPAARGLAEHLRKLGIRDQAVLRAVREVPREAFLPPELREFAYQDTPLPIGEGQTISQPFIVALMAEAARLSPGDRVLEVGTGSGYAAALFSRLAERVYTIERLAGLADLARARLDELRLDNVEVRCGDGTLGWPEAAPFDAILVAAGGPDVPDALLDQLTDGGRLVIPVGESTREQSLVRVERRDGSFERVDLGAVRFVPLIGEGGWAPEAPDADPTELSRDRPALARHVATGAIVRILRETAEPVSDIDSVDLGSLVERIGDARVVLLGEATHGTSEFYRMRAGVTRELVERHGFTIVAIEGDWPDAAQVHRWALGESPDGRPPPFARFPTWMWRNRETVDFAHWLREHNERRDPDDRAGFYGLDLYSLHASIDEVLRYLTDVDPNAARVARERYGCLTPWQKDPATYGRAVLTGRYRLCEDEVVAMLDDLLAQRLDYQRRDGARFLDAVQNAKLVADAELYYRTMYRGGHAAWNLRDRHMFETLRLLMTWRGDDARAVVWAHNSHVGDARATEMGAQGQKTVGEMCRIWRGGDAYLVGLGTDHGTVAAAHDWGDPMRVQPLRPSHPESYERLCHDTDVASFVLHLKEPARDEVRGELEDARLERAVGVVYRPETELQSHYFHASLPHQFDSWIWFDETTAVEPLPGPVLAGEPSVHPFGV
jgi:protein-L-isoaspartate(D-aspartate) O-methyltransferase